MGLKMSDDEFSTVVADGGRCSTDQMARMTEAQLTKLKDIILSIRTGFRQIDYMAQQSIDDIDLWLATCQDPPSWRLAWRSSRLYADYIDWCTTSQKAPVSNISWGSVLTDRGYRPIQKAGERKRRLYHA